MKKLLLLLVLTTLLEPVFSQQICIADDELGDCYTPNTDLVCLFYELDTASDSIYFIIETSSDRTDDFGFAIAMDTDLVITNGSYLPQNNLFVSSANNSMKFDLVAYVYQNSIFPGVFANVYDASMSLVSSIDPHVKFISSKKIAIGFKYSQIAPHQKINLLGGSGSFDVGPGGAGVWDVLPDVLYATVPSLDKPELVMPAHESVNVDYNTVQLHWSPVKGAVDYHLEVCVDINFVSLLLPVTSSDTFYNCTGLLPSTTYYWKVQAIKDSVSSIWSDHYQFTTAEQNDVASIDGIECLKVFPNPSSGKWYINELPGCLPDRFQVRMLDVGGRLVKDFGYVTKDAFGEIEVPGLNKGSYFLEFRLSRDKFLVKRLILK